MPDPAHLAAGTPARPRKRALRALAAALLLAAGFFAYSAQSAPGAHADTVVTGGLDVSVDPGSATVGLATVSATITYTCTVTTPDGQGQLRVDFDQNGNDTSGETAVGCGAGDVSQTQTVTAVQLGMNASQDISATAVLDDGTTAVTVTSDSLNFGAAASINPTADFPGDGTITLTGSYTCTLALVQTLVITASQEDDNGNVATGSTEFGLDCTGHSQTFDATIASGSGSAFSPANGEITVTLVTSHAPPESGLTPTTSMSILD